MSAYKIFRQSIEAETLLDKFAPVVIEDIKAKAAPIFKLKHRYSDSLAEHCNQLENFSQFNSLVSKIKETIKQLSEDFKDCEDNINYFTLVFMGAVSAGKTSMICDLLNMSPDQLNKSLESEPQFESEDEISIDEEVATTNLYEFLIESSHLRLVDVPGTGGVIHDNKTLAPFVNKAECIIFLCNAAGAFSNDDYEFVLHHIVGLEKENDLTSETVSNKKVLIVVNKWETTNARFPDFDKQNKWKKRTNWILNGGVKGGKKFSGISKLFRRRLEIVPADTSQRSLNPDTETYNCFGEPKLDEMLNTLKEILIEEGNSLKLERPQQVLKNALRNTGEILKDERVRSSVDELVEKLEELGVDVRINTPNIMNLLTSQLDDIKKKIQENLFVQIRDIITPWKPRVGVVDRLRMLRPGSLEAKADLRKVWNDELQNLLESNLSFDTIKGYLKNEIDSVSKKLEEIFLYQLEDVKLKTFISESKLSSSTNKEVDFNVSSYDELERAINKAVSHIKLNIVGDLVAAVTFDAVLGLLLGGFLNLPGIMLFIIGRRFVQGNYETQKAKQELEDAIKSITDEVAADLKEQIANQLREAVQNAIDILMNKIQDERGRLSEPLQALDKAVSEVTQFRDELKNISLSENTLDLSENSKANLLLSLNPVE